MDDVALFRFCQHSNHSLELQPLQSLSLQDMALARGIHFGQGVFETLAVIDHHIVLQQAHFDRLRLGADALGLHFCLEQCQSVLEAFTRHCQNGILKITLLAMHSATAQPRGYGTLSMCDALLMLQFSTTIMMPEPQRLCRIQEPCYPWPKALVGLKMVAALQYVHWASYALSQGAHQGVLFDEHEYLVECTSSNIVISNEPGCWQTPKLSTAGVRGTLRQVLLDSNVIQEQNLTELDLCEARQVYVINSVRGAQPVLSYAGPNLNQTWNQSVLDQHSCVFEQHVRDVLSQY